MTHTAPYGSWKSPITSDALVAGTVGLSHIALDGAAACWIESRPTEGGRCVVARCGPDGVLSDAIPPSLNARTTVHEYGGGAYLAVDGTRYIANFSDQRLYRIRPGEMPHPITPPTNTRYADAILDRQRNRLICVREDHTMAGREAVNAVVALDLAEARTGQVLVDGEDFYASPRLNPSGTQLAWLSWNHPNMPWDGTELWVADVNANGLLGPRQRVAGGVNESIFQPEWSPGGELFFVSDRTGWWNLYRWRDRRVDPVCATAPERAEFGVPQWVFGLSTYAFESAHRLVCTYTQEGTWYLASVNAMTGRLEPIEIPYTSIASLRAAPGRAVFVGSSPTDMPAVVEVDLATHRVTTLRRSSDLAFDSGYLSTAQSLEFPTENGLTAHGLFYPPKNRDYVGPVDERPPLIVISHGGPTSARSSSLDLGIQYWTSRGFAVLDVNYGGSTGYGRPYRERLRGQWGVVDVDDCANGARYLVERDWVDGQRLIIRGGSAGGYTTLCALTFRDVFKAGASYYGLSDLEAFVQETHKFESRYLDGLVGSYREQRSTYVERSPLHFVEHVSCPVIFFQGLEDKVVPPNQAEKMVDALRAKGVPVAYLAFAGEQHGFRRAENIKRALDAELYFYSRVFGFELADPVEPIEIENL